MLLEKVKAVDSKERLADFVAALAKDLQENSEEWENVTLERFLGAMEAWIGSYGWVLQKHGAADSRFAYVADVCGYLDGSSGVRISCHCREPDLARPPCMRSLTHAL